ncbi:GH36-type glycosyl hydrolase domain-containing protein [Paenibacillus thailandensis]|uniref:GH36-type glycosyl hydrolase domain-containing protein n=1 Tax=Paenibacillus thailandensis TaxID=393250 RepID=A0ABW5QQK4_9BACL
MIPTVEQLEASARELALIHHPVRASARSIGQLRRAFRSDRARLGSFAAELKQSESRAFQPAEQWLTDHADYIESEAFAVESGMEDKFAGRLIRLKPGGEPRVLDLCLHYLKQTDGALDTESFIRFVNAYQDVASLNIAEVWSLPTLLRIAAIRHLALLMDDVRERRLACIKAETILAPFLEGRSGPNAQSVSEALDRAGEQLPLSAAVVVHLAGQLNELAEEAGEVREWLLCKLDNGAESLNKLIMYEHQLQASYEVTAGHLVQTLRTLSRAEWSMHFGRMSVSERTLRQEHAGSYPAMDEQSRHTLRRQVEKLAARYGVPENMVAQQAVALAERHSADPAERNNERDSGEALLPRQAFAAYYLLDAPGQRELYRSLRECGNPRRKLSGQLRVLPGTGAYLSWTVLLFAVLLAAAGWITAAAQRGPMDAFAWAAAILVLALPVTDWAVAVMHGLIGRLFEARPLLRYDYTQGIDKDAASIVVIPVIWSKAEDVYETMDRLELHYLANRDDNLAFAVLGDYADALSEEAETDELIRQTAISRIDELNRIYGDAEAGTGPFLLFQRKRQFNEAEGVWMGWERKRGKLVEFVELLRGGTETSYHCTAGDCSSLDRFRYVITLDADTELPVGAAKRMVGTMHLPYNRARLNRSRTRVAEGYGVLQPRVGISYEAVSRSRLAKLWAGRPGIDPYAFAMSDPYQDAFGQGIFTGKGIFDIDAFRQVLSGRIPENRVLSHDLLEGGFLRGGLLSDIEIVDGHPATFQAYQQRMHRWVRGDWQLVLWLRSHMEDRDGNRRPVDLGGLTRWQIVDNMRRSLMPPAIFALLAVGALIGGGAGSALLAIGLATLALPFIRALFDPKRIVRKPQFLLAALGQSAVSLITLPYQAFVMADAIVRTSYRVTWSKKRLLEWVSSAEVERNGAGRGAPLLGYWPGLALTVLFSLAAGLYASGAALAMGLTVAVLWLLAPALATWLNGAPVSGRQEPLTASEQEKLRELAAQIWAYYENYAVEGDNWLPPDNVQIDPPVGVAHRTSPTNIGLALACAVTARDFGFITTEGLLTRVSRTLDTIEKMDKWFGHLYNWYDTETLRPLPPLYVSTVDSGNFIAYLIAVKQGILDWARRDEESEGPSLTERANAIAERIEAIVRATDFRPLFDGEAGLFALGYHAALDRRETILYDLLASEARQASFLAIAFGQVPASHWFKLGRTMTKSGKFATLLSWSGTMFEFLMPALLMRTYRDTIWDCTYKGVVARQIHYAAQRGVPFGISESGYYAFDYQMNYQYRAFGVPGLGFQRGLENDLVLAPYAAIMALPVDKREALASLERMEKLGARGEHGYFEAIDFTSGRLPAGRDHIVVKSFMAHHLGMSLLTLGNMLLPDTMVERFHADKRVQAAELLLQERVPEKPAMIRNGYRPVSARQEAAKAAGTRIPLREFDGPAPTPEVCVLSNGSFTRIVSDNGGGFSASGGVRLSRWHEDPVAELPGSGFYIRDVSAGTVWSPAFEPCRTPADRQKVRFALDKASFERADGDLETLLEICVPPQLNAELCRLTLTNTGKDTRIVEVTSYVELALAPPASDEAHPAFSKLFVKTEYDSAAGSLLAVRRPRTGSEQPVWAAHSLSAGCETLGPPEYETDVACFVGRGHSLARPVGLECKLSGTTGAVLNPGFMMRRRISIGPEESVKLFAVTGMAPSREEALAMTAAVCGERQAEQAFQLAWTHSRIDLRHQHLTALEASEFHSLAGRLLYQSPLRKERAEGIAANASGQSGLWPLGISGDLPIATVAIADQSQIKFAAKALTGHAYLKRKGIAFDLLFIIEQAGGYYQQLQDAIRRAAEQAGDGLSGPGGVFQANADSLTEAQRALIAAVARVSLRADGPSLKAQLGAGGRRRKLRDSRIREAANDAANDEAVLGDAQTADASADLPAAEVRASEHDALEAERLPTIEGLPPDFRLLPETEERAPAGGSAAEAAEFAEPAPDRLAMFNGWGGFAGEGREYVVTMRDGKYLTAPWSNVMANPSFGTMVTELGTGYTWYRNSREFKLTPWSNDPVLDVPGEICYIRDEQTGKIWSGAPAPDPGNEAYDVAHGFGYSRFTRVTEGLSQRMTVFVDKEEPVKFVLLELRNDTDKRRELSVAYYVNWVLGVRRQANAPFVVTEWEEEAAALLARNVYQETFRDSVAFLHLLSDEAGGTNGRPAVSYTADRLAFIGRGGSLAAPEGLSDAGLPDSAGAFADSCGVVRMKLTIEPRSVRKAVVLLGAAESRAGAVELVRRFGTVNGCESALAGVRNYWEETLGQIRVSTPNREMDVMLNGWLLYQALSCRIWARTAFYQAGGAYGFRDQLQDSLALLHTRPDLTRKQILLHAAHQYEEGDVQHWWHEETERGIRTKYSDDLLWLPYAVARYIAHTGDTGILDETAPFLTSPVLTEEEHERYEATVQSGSSGTVYEHCVRAIEKASRCGEHGIPLMGIGDWNDGMNSVGDEGRGESVWLGWFLSDVLRKFGAVCELKGDAERAEAYRSRRDSIAEAINRDAWDGEWFRRACTDEGTWLGSHRNDECRIDAIAQSWSVLSGGAPEERARQAMRSFDRELVDRELSVARLLTPAFDRTDPSPGYIQGYPPGIRENGAQYTHGVIWSIVAWSELGDGDKAMELFHLLNPVTHAQSPGEVRKYAGEPYVMAADVYTGEPYKGRAGWTWYTGASGWMYQAGIEAVLGIRRIKDRLYVLPAVPAGWTQYSFRYRFGSSLYNVKVNLHADTGGGRVELDGRPVEQAEAGAEGRPALSVPLRDDGAEHSAEFYMPPVVPRALPSVGGEAPRTAAAPRS